MLQFGSPVVASAIAVPPCCAVLLFLGGKLLKENRWRISRLSGNFFDNPLIALMLASSSITAISHTARLVQLIEK